MNRSQLTRRAFLAVTAGAVGGLAVPSPAAGAGASSAAAGGSGVSWINRHATPLTGTDPQQAAGDLRHLRGVVRGAAIVGLGESAHGTHTQLRLKHRVARYLVENLGFRTINAHTAAVPRMLVSFPDDQPGDDTVERQLAGGRLRRQHGRRYVSIGISFDHGQVLTGWEVQPGGPAVDDVPPPDLSLVDHVLGQAREPDYLIDLRHDGPPPVRRWLEGAAKMRIIGSAYHPDRDTDYAITVDPWGGAFDAILHLGRVTPSRLLAAGQGLP